MTELVRFTSLVDMQENCCKRFASNNLFGTKRNGAWEWITYAQFGEMVADCRAGLAGLGVQHGQKVAFIANNRVEWAVAAYATYSLGAHFVPMYEAQLPKEWQYILKDSDAVALIVSAESIYEQVKDWPGQVGSLKAVVCIDTDDAKPHSWGALMQAGADRPVPSVNPAPSETAGLIYTSGTTGEPKGVILSHGNIVSNINAVHDIFPMSEEDTSCSFLPWAHSFGQTVELHVLLSMGAAIGIAESVNKLIDNFGEIRPTILFAVPRIFNRIYDGLQKRMAEESPVKRALFHMGLDVAKKRRELAEKGQKSAWLDAQYNLFDKVVFSKVKARFGGRLRYAFSGGAALSKEVGTFIDDIGILVFEGYGLTETSPIATANTPAARRLGTIGKPIPGVEIYICDEDQNVLPADTDGEIVVVGPNVMQGYHNKPEANAEVLFELNGRRAFRTGDMGRTTKDGFVVITGRFKEQYKLENGKYVSPSPLEELLKLSGFISQAFIYGDNRPYNVALVVPDFEAVTKWCREHNLDTSNPGVMIAHPQVKALIEQEVAKYANDGFKGFEKPARVGLLTEEFTTENDLLTPKMSVKRRNVVARYRTMLDGLYA
jgi:long-chain acyl-CoA synthetase